MAIIDRVKPEGKKRILALDGGGIRGLITIEMLAVIEAELRKKTGNLNYVLSDFFDFVAGTSTGAVISTCISMGMSMDDVRKFYLDSGKQMFDPAFLLKRLQYKYEDEPLANKLKEVLGSDTTLGSDRLKTVLMMVMRNATTDSPWPVSNNPQAKYNATTRDDCNLRLPLWQLVRASTAAPTYFPPEVVTFGANGPKPYSFIFVDGGVTTYNNPAFLAFQMATAHSYNMGWKAGEEDMLVVSLGTGGSSLGNAQLAPEKLTLLYYGMNVADALMNAASAGWDMACRTVGACRFGPSIDREFDTMVGVPSGNVPRLFSYARYSPALTKEGLAAIGLPDIRPEDVQKLDSVEHMDELQAMGQAYAKKSFDISHFKHFT
jgi:uncharacterized protein